MAVFVRRVQKDLIAFLVSSLTKLVCSQKSVDLHSKRFWTPKEKAACVRASNGIVKNLETSVHFALYVFKLTVVPLQSYVPEFMLPQLPL